MAVVASRPSVAITPTLIAQNAAGDDGPADVTAKSFVLKNMSATGSVFLGPAGVTTATGYEWVSGDGRMSITLEPGESLYGIVTAVSQVVHVLAHGR